MAKLIITLDGQLLSEFELDKERVTIGRKPDNDILIDNLAISGEHAAIATFYNDAFLTHIQGDRYPLVNGQALDAHPRQLVDHDVIELTGVKWSFT